MILEIVEPLIFVFNPANYQDDPLEIQGAKIKFIHFHTRAKRLGLVTKQYEKGDEFGIVLLDAQVKLEEAPMLNMFEQLITEYWHFKLEYSRIGFPTDFGLRLTNASCKSVLTFQ